MIVAKRRTPSAPRPCFGCQSAVRCCCCCHCALSFLTLAEQFSPRGGSVPCPRHLAQSGQRSQLLQFGATHRERSGRAAALGREAPSASAVRRTRPAALLCVLNRPERKMLPLGCRAESRCREPQPLPAVRGTRCRCWCGQGQRVVPAGWVRVKASVPFK